MLQYPYLFPGLLSGVVSWKLGGTRLVVIGESGDHGHQTRKVVPRGGLRTTLYYDESADGSVFFKARSPVVAQKLAVIGREGSAVYEILRDGRLDKVHEETTS